MNVVLNGQDTRIETAVTIADLLDERGLATKPCAVEVNETLVPKARHGDVRLNDGDRVEIVTLVGGG